MLAIALYGCFGMSHHFSQIYWFKWAINHVRPEEPLHVLKALQAPWVHHTLKVYNMCMMCDFSVSLSFLGCICMFWLPHCCHSSKIPPHHGPKSKPLSCENADWDKPAWHAAPPVPEIPVRLQICPNEQKNVKGDAVGAFT